MHLFFVVVTLLHNRREIFKVFLIIDIGKCFQSIELINDIIITV